MRERLQLPGGPRLPRRALFGAAASAVLGAGTVARAQAPSRDTLRLGLENYPPNLNPYQHTGSASGTVKLLIHRGLLSYDAAGGVQPEIAESWRIENGVDYIFVLRGNAKFHNGEPVTPDDVRYSLMLMQTDKTARLWGVANLIASITTLDARTLKVTLKQPTASFAQAIANLNFGVISAKAHTADPHQFIGAGPYRVVNEERGVGIDLEAFKDFYRPGRPKLPRIRMTAYTDDSLRATALDAGDADIIEDVPWSNLDAMQRNPRLSVQSQNGAFMFLTFNTTQGPFANAKVRQAVAFAMNRPDLLNSVFFGKGAPLDGLPIPEDSPFFDKATSRLWPYDPDRARSLLKEAGYPNGFQTFLLTTTSPIMHEQASVVVQQSLAAVGVDVQLKTMDWGARVAAGNKGQYEFAMNGTALDFNDPDALSTLMGPGPLTYQRSVGLNSRALDKLLVDGRSELDPAKRRDIYAALSRQVAVDVPIVTLNWRVQSYGLQSFVKGFHNLPGFLTFHSGITIEDVSFA